MINEKSPYKSFGSKKQLEIELNFLRSQNQHLKDSIILQQKQIEGHMKEKNIYEMRIKGLEQFIEGLKSQLHNGGTETKSNIVQMKSMSNSGVLNCSQSPDKARRQCRPIQNLLVPLKYQQPQSLQLKKKSSQNSLFKNCIRKLASYDAPSPPSLTKSYNHQQGSSFSLSTLKNSRPSFDSKIKISNQNKQQSQLPKELCKKKSYLQKLKVNQSLD